jgi:DNA polymerase
MTFHLDYESRSEAPLADDKAKGEKGVGAFRYANDPSTRILCCAVAEGEQEPRIWRCDEPASPESRAALDLLRKISENPDALVYAHNATGFEVPMSDALWHATFGFPPPQHHQWRCTAVMARKASLPYSLAKLAEKLGIDQQKDRSGYNLIRKFSIPPFVEPHEEPEEWQRFLDYCLQDVRVEQEIHRVLRKFELKGAPLNTFLADMEMNCRGLPINVSAVENAQRIVEQAIGPAETEFRELTGLNYTQQAKVLVWCQERGYPHDDLQRETLDEWLEEAEDSDLKTALSIRRDINFAANKKLTPMADCAGPHDNKVRGTLMYLGASRTGRWSGSLIQIQNVKKPPRHLENCTKDIYRAICRGADAEEIDLCYGNPLEAVASCMRHFVDDGKPMLNVDYSAIESRTLAWGAGEEWKLEVFRTHGMIYETLASQMFGVSVADVDKALRAKGKIGELSCQYGGSVGALAKMGGLKMGLTEGELRSIVDRWRTANPKIVSLWRKFEDAAKAAVTDPGRHFEVGDTADFFSGRTAGMNFLFMRLPSGRCLCYPEPRLEWVPAPWDKAQLIEQITFYSQLPMKSTWGRITTHGSKLLENWNQGTAFDLMAHGFVNAERHGYRAAALIHDEFLGYKDGPHQSVEELTSLLTELPPWAKGLPLTAEGGEIDFYQK